MLLRSLLRNGCRLNASIRMLSVAAPESESAQKPISKEAMLKLRKRTGYSFVNCRKALLKFGEENMSDAEKYLKELAVKEGWAKAAKVGGRQTSQGQCGIVAAANMAAVVELKCETDFVAKSAPFRALVADLANGVLDYAKQNGSVVRAPTDAHGAKVVDVSLKELKTPSGATADAAIAAVIGTLGENISFSRAHLLVSHADVSVHGFSHPNEIVDNVGIGRFVSAIGVKRAESGSSFPTHTLAYQLCQHIIGLNPKSIGQAIDGAKSTTVDENSAETSAADAEEGSAQKSTEESSEDIDKELNSFAEVESTRIDEDETQLLRQAFMLNPRQRVSEYLDSHGCQVLDFWRFELGKSGESVEESA